MIKLTRAHPLYPSRLRGVAKAPDELWLWGTMPSEGHKTLGIVGTRRFTPVGTRIARLVATALARAGAVIVSGLAVGIDSVSHAAALDVGGQTIAVLGEGLAHFDEYGPLRRQKLARRIREQGALLSEYPLDLGGREWTYPKRNRTIAALSDVVVVIEAPEESGALITAREARDLGRPVFVVPGPIDAPTWLGSNGYIKKGDGVMLASVGQIADALELTLAPVGAESSDRSQAVRLAEILAGEPADTDTIAKVLEMRSADAATLIAEELISGHIVPTGDGRFALR